MNLCIDWGNTRIKTAVFNEENLVNEYNFSEEEALISIMQIVEQVQPNACILSAVANHPPELPALLREKCKLIILDKDTPLPLMNAYFSTDTLGSDRVALAVAANHKYKNSNSLTVAVGTAITYNFVQSTGTFRGGAISPGMLIRFEALHRFTDKLPLVQSQGPLILLGYDTETGIRSGVINGMQCEIDGMIDEYRRQYPDVQVVLTGGDGPLFADKLKNRIFADPNFLLKGLNLILLHNAR